MNKQHVTCSYYILLVMNFHMTQRERRREGQEEVTGDGKGWYRSREERTDKARREDGAKNLSLFAKEG